MKVLIYGAGVIGSIYAGHLHQAGTDVTMLARSERFVELRQHGLMLQDAFTGEVAYHRIPVTDSIGHSETFDLTIVAVRQDQLPGVLPALGGRNLGDLLFMVNNVGGYKAWSDVVGESRIFAGFPGAGGTIVNHVVQYRILSPWLQPTTLGELDGKHSPRLKRIASVLRRSGFPVAMCRNMDAWQKTHVAIVSPLANAIYMARGSGMDLAQMHEAVNLWIAAIREGFAVLEALKVPITPARWRMISWIPQSLLASRMCAWAKTEQFGTVAVGHANAAADEMRTLADDFKELALKTPVLTPAMDKLRTFIPTRAIAAAA